MIFYVFLKSKSKKQYNINQQIIKDSNMQDSQRHLSFNKFVQERSIEIAKFLTDLELDTKKKGHQALPRSIRRRAMSHNRYRIPKKLRKNMEDQLAKAQTMQKIPKCRKHIRKRRGLIMAYKLRNSKVKWLSTHLWAARRMRMVQYYGYKVAQTSNNKCFRSAYRHFRHNCCLLDLSYYNCLSLNFESETLPQNIHISSKEQLPTYNKIYEIQLFSSINRDRMICPAYLIRYNNEPHKLSLKIFFHPAAVEEVSKIVFEEKITANLEQGQCEIYLIIGPESNSMVSSALQQYGILKKEESLSSQFYNQYNRLIYLSKQQNFEMVNKPQVDCPIPLQKQVKKQYSIAQNVSLRQNMLKIYQNLKKQAISSKDIVQKQNKSFWEYYERGQNKNLQQTVFRITLRSRYTHKRNNKVSKAEKKRIVEAERQSPRQKKPKRESNSMKDENESSSSLNFSKQIYIDTPIHKNAVLQEIHSVAVGQVGQGMIKGLLLLGSNSNSCKLWRILTHLNIKVIGRRQYCHMHLQSAKLLFPENYVHTKSYLNYQKEQQSKLFSKYKRYPLQKQPHYFALNSPKPFGFVPKQPIIVSVQMVGKGKCFEMSYICELHQADLPKISKLLDDGKVGIIQSDQIADKNITRKRYVAMEEIQIDLKFCQPKRKIIGHITTGGYLFSHSRQGGIGFIDKQLMTQNYLQKFGGYVFVRKTTSRHYYLANIEKQFN